MVKSKFLIALAITIIMTFIPVTKADAASTEKSFTISGKTITSSTDQLTLLAECLGFTYSSSGVHASICSSVTMESYVLYEGYRCPACNTMFPNSRFEGSMHKTNYVDASQYQCNISSSTGLGLFGVGRLEGGFSSYKVKILTGYPNQYSYTDPTYRATYIDETCSCGQRVNYPHYSLYGYGDESTVVTTYSDISLTDSGIPYNTVSLTFENCTISSMPSWLYSTSLGVKFRNCTFNCPVPQETYFDFRNCSGSITNFTDTTPLDDNPRFSIARWTPYTGSLYELQWLSDRKWVVDYTSNPKATQVSSLTIADNGGFALRNNTTSQLPTISPSAKTIWLRLKQWPGLTQTPKVAGEFSIDSYIANDITVTGTTALLNLKTSGDLGGLLQFGVSSNITASSISPLPGSAISSNSTLTSQSEVSTSNIALVMGKLVAPEIKLQSAILNGGTLQATGAVSLLSGGIGGASVTLSGSSVSIPNNIKAASTRLSIVCSDSVFSTKSLTVNGLTLSQNVSDPNTTSSTGVLDRCVFSGNSSVSVGGETSLSLLSCTAKSTVSSTGSGEVIIDGGSYSGSPAVTGSNITVKRGTFTDTGGTASQFLVDPESESTSTTSGDKTITTVKLSNPPIVIDWDEFPFEDFWGSMPPTDNAAPIITVTRDDNPNEPTDSVTLTITSKDPNGNDAELPISINGGEYQASPATITITENQAVNIAAVDKEGNVRSYIAYIENIDSEAPTIKGITQSTTTWTKYAVTLTADASDDIKLADKAYKWTLTPSDGSSQVVTDWQASKTFKVSKSGTVKLEVKDAMGKTAVIDDYIVSNIDYIAPTAYVTYSADANNPVSESIGVKVYVNIVDNLDPLTQDSSGLTSAPVMWDEKTQNWTSELEKTFYENTSFTIKVRDAVGNISEAIPVNVTGISTNGPVITSFSGDNFGRNFVAPPVTLKVIAQAGSDAPLDSKPYSWDNGKTWTSISTMKVDDNGEYTVMVRDKIGNIAQATYVVSNIDAYPPTASIYLYKGPAADEPDPSNVTVDEYVWKLRIEASDYGSQIDHIETLWDSGTTTKLPIIYDVSEPGVYGAIVVDAAGNETYVEKVVSAENIGGSTSDLTNSEYVNIQVSEDGSAGPYYKAGLQDLIFGEPAVYNLKTDSVMDWEDSNKQIPVHLVAHTKRGRWVSGYLTVDGLKYNLTFEGGQTVVQDTSNDSLSFEAKIPFADLSKDLKNARIKVVIQEWKEESQSTLLREGSVTLYLNVQKSQPALTWTYNKATDELTLAATSTVAGIRGIAYQFDGGASNSYSSPVVVNGASTIIIAAEDKVGNHIQIELDGSDLPLNGSGGGTLPTEDIGNGSSVTSYHISNKAADIYIIGGTRGNTDAVPAGSVFNFD